MVAGSLDDLVRDLRGFENRKEVLKALRKEIRQPLPAVRRSIRQRALLTMPSSNGLNKWVSKTSITAQIRVSARAASVRLKGGRNSMNKRSDIRAIDRGRVRAPSWGRRGPGQWHTQTVDPGFFTKAASDEDNNFAAWRSACVQAVDNALDVIRRG